MTNRQAKQEEFAIDVVRRLHDEGFEALWAGGCVRDRLLGREPTDYDVATSARPEQVRDLFGHRRTLAIGAAFGVVAVLGGRSRRPVEVATFRSDGAYLDGRRPQEVSFTDAEHDAERRDFTINGLFLDPLSGELLDYVGGQRDLEAGVVRAIGDPRRRFEEDKLRMLRAVRFATRFAFHIESHTMQAICDMANDVLSVSAERIGAELTVIFEHQHRARGVELLWESRLLKALLPSLHERALGDPEAWRRKLDRLRLLETATVSMTLALLLEGVATPEEGSELCRQFRLTNKKANRTAWLLTQIPVFHGAAELPWPRLQRLLVHDGAAELIGLMSVLLPQGDPGLRRCLDALSLSEETLNPPPLATGKDLIAHGMQSGPHFSALLEHLRDAQLEGRLTSKNDALAEAADWLVRRTEEKGP